jgi:hypothetical protein
MEEENITEKIPRENIILHDGEEVTVYELEEGEKIVFKLRPDQFKLSACYAQTVWWRHAPILDDPTGPRSVLISPKRYPVEYLGAFVRGTIRPGPREAYTLVFESKEGEKEIVYDYNGKRQFMEVPCEDDFELKGGRRGRRGRRRTMRMRANKSRRRRSSSKSRRRR